MVNGNLRHSVEIEVNYPKKEWSDKFEHYY